MGIGILALALLAGCASTAPEQDGAAVEDRSKPLAPEVMRPKPAPDTGTKPLDQRPVVGDPLKDPGNVLSKRSIFFDFDSNLVKDEYKPVVAAHARYLQENRGKKMRVEGNADERGSREYNIALGQRRADAVRQMMQLLGAQASQIESVSYGEEKPRCAGHDETCWWQNRRGDIVYQGE
jgi:peptidoglycan-associated lipoprotein